MINKISHVCLEIEHAMSSAKEDPRHKYVSRPVYKTCVPHVGEILATAVSFLATDLICHQFAGYVIRRTFLDSNHTWSWSPLQSLAWVAIGLPIMYAKYMKRNLPR